MKRGIAATVAVLAVVGLAGCSSIDSGRITAKNSTEPYITQQQYCMDGYTLYPGTPRYDANGNLVPGSYPCFPGRTEDIYHEATYKFDLAQGDDTGWVWVDEGTFVEYGVGDYYGSDEDGGNF